MASDKWSQRGYESNEIAYRYIRFRPNPPQQLIDRIVGFLKEKYDGELNLCVDVGCGSGQCSVLFASHFKKVLGTDISESQVEVAREQEHPPNVEYEVSPAEKCPVEDGSVQLINAAVAAHWFDLPAYFKEVDRILSPNGIVAISSYGAEVEFSHPTAAEGLLAALRQFYKVRLDGYWAPGLKHVLNDYADVIIPYPGAFREDIWKEESLTLTGYVNLLSSWCSYNNYCKAHGEEAGLEVLKEFETNMKKALGTEEHSDNVVIYFRRKYYLLMGRKPEA